MPESKPSTWPVSAVTFLLLVGMLLLGERVAAAAAQRGVSPLATLLALAGVSVAWTLAVAGAAAAVAGGGVVASLGLGHSRLSAAGTAIAIAGGLALSQSIDLALRLTGIGRGPSLERMIDALATARGPGLLAAVLVIGLGAGVAEEAFFRGWAQRRLVARAGAPLGIAIAATLFALAHGEPRHALFAFGFGLYAGAVAFWSDSTRPAIAVHAANNVVSVLGIAGGLDALEARVPRSALVVLGVVLAACALACLGAVRRRAAGWTSPAGPVRVET